MADNLDFDSLADFATLSMLPVGDEEVNAIWGRKVVNNSGKAIGAWGTIILEEITGNLGTKKILFPSGFKHMPSVDVFQLRGATQIDMNIRGMSVMETEDNDRGLVGLRMAIDGPDFLFEYRPDHLNLTSIPTSFDRTDFGTFMYRFRGW